MTSNASRSLDIGIVLGEEIPDVAKLEEVETGPVDWSDDCVQGEGGWVSLVLTDDGTAEVVVLAIFWYGKGIVDAHNDHQKPADDGQDLVGQESLGVV